MHTVGMLCAIAAIAALAHPSPTPTPTTTTTHLTTTAPRPTLEQLRTAIEIVESSGNPRAVGDGGEAVGILQIHPILVEDVNRILGQERYTVEDRWCVAKSREMFAVYTRHYTRCLTPERVARRWNGGPRGDRMRATLPYWRKVQRELAKQEESR